MLPYTKNMILIFSIFFLVGCENVDKGSRNAASINKFVVKLNPTEGNNAKGVVSFTKIVGGVRVAGHVEGLPVGEHGFHIHQFGDCSSPNGKSAGGHFNPEGVDHGGPNDEIRHVGDLGNIIANSEGVAHFEYTDKKITLAGAWSILGRGVIIHAGSDDLTSQPTGAAGARLACGVVGIANN